MERNLTNLKALLKPFVILLGLTGLLGTCPLDAVADELDLLSKIISTQNSLELKQSLAEGSYRGEAGILRVKPDVASSLGLIVYMDQDYLDSAKLFKEAEASLERAQEELASTEKESFLEEHVHRAASFFLAYKHSSQEAEEKLEAYRLRISPKNDERLNEKICFSLMKRLLNEALEKAGYNLRDTLGYFYNACRGADKDTPFLTTENVKFVNKVFYQFTRLCPKEALKRFDLGTQEDFYHGKDPAMWKEIIAETEFPYLSLLETTLKKHNNGKHRVDPLLFVALMRKESNFHPHAISSVGAAGLTQIMPRTALGLGMKNIFIPPYLSKAGLMLEKQRKTKEQALNVLFQINENNKLEKARLARSLMQKSLKFSKKKDRLFGRYRKELLLSNTDDRLKPELAIEYGFKYFQQLMRAQKGDITLALASYNAGPHRVRRFNGVPPFDETVNFRNQVLRFYKAYLDKLKGARQVSKGP